MAHIRVTLTKQGYRYSVLAEMEGKRRSLGTFADEQQAMQVLEAHIANQRRDITTITYRTLVEDIWASSTTLAPSTRGHYLRLLRRLVLPLLGGYTIPAITVARVSALLSSLRESGVGTFTVYQVKCAISSTLQALVDEGALSANPVREVSASRPRAKARPVLSPTDVRAIQEHLTPAQALFARFLVETGARFGEASEIRVMDLALPGIAVAIRRAVVDIGAQMHPDGRSRFLVKGTKSGNERMSSITPSTAETLMAWIRDHHLQPGDLVFPRSLLITAKPAIATQQPLATRPPQVGDIIEGTAYRHGTLSAYSHARCRCLECRIASSWYAQQRKQQRKQRPVSIADDHLPKDCWWRIWNAATAAAGIGWKVRTHDLRHASATWAVKAGADLHTVKERLGHHSITVTEGYLHAMEGDNDRISEIFANL